MRLLQTHILLLGLLLFGAVQAFAQINPLNAQREFSGSTFITDYKAMRVNPANIGLRNPSNQQWSVGMLDVDGIIYSESLKRSVFHKNTGYKTPEGNIIIPKDQGFSLQNILRDQLSVNTEVGVFSAAYHHKKYGSFSFQASTRINVETYFNGFAHDVLFGGSGFDNYIDTIVKIIVANIEADGRVNEKRVLALLEDSYLKMSVVQDYSIGYSRKLVQEGKWQLYGGATLGYLHGTADMAIRFNQGDISGYVARIPFVEEDLGSVNLPSNVNTRNRSGHGMKTGFGFTALHGDKLRFGFSMVDLGFIKWPVNPIITKQNLDDQVDLSEGVDAALDGLIDDGIFYYLGNQNNIEVLPTKLITGASYRVHEYIDVYADFMLPLNNSPKNLTTPAGGAGAQFSVLNYAFLKTGVSYSDKRLNMPTYISVFAGRNKNYELGIGTADLLSYFLVDRDYFQFTTSTFRFHF